MSDDLVVVRFVDAPSAGDRVLMRFADPAVRYAVVPSGALEAGGWALLVRIVADAQSEAAWLDEAEGLTVSAKLRGAQVLWRPGRAVLQCDAEQADLLLPALVEFAHYEAELRRIEGETAAAWDELDEDKGLAFDVTTADLRRSPVVGDRMSRTLVRRMHLARLEPHLYAPDAGLNEAGRALGEQLRERSGVEDRLEIADGQIEVFEGIYEMSGQRMGEYRAARQSHVIELVIIGLLAAETLVMLAQMLLHGRG
jgi:hypothetical protein